MILYGGDLFFDKIARELGMRVYTQKKLSGRIVKHNIKPVLYRNVLVYEYSYVIVFLAVTVAKTLEDVHGVVLRTAVH